MLSRPAAMFATAPEEYAAHPVPSLEEWNSLWKAWDTVTRQMIPVEELNEIVVEEYRRARVAAVGKDDPAGR